MAKTTKIILPSVRLPSVPLPKSPPGWNRSEITIRRRNMPGLADYREREPAGEIPAGVKARFPTMTKPEWAVWWGLLKNGKQPDIDFTYVAVLMGVGVSYYSTVDFLLPRDEVAFEVQGEFWHYGVGSAKQHHDMMRYQYFAQQGVTLIFMDEEDCLRRPAWLVKEALALRDHSKMGSNL